MLRARESDQEANRAGLDRGIGERAWGNRGGIECGGERLGGFRLRPLFRGREEEKGRAWATGGGGVLSGELGLWGLYRSFLRDARVIS